jgi:hypothetical protein
MSVLRWIWRVILLVVVGCFVTTVYYMTHNVDMDLVLPAVNVAGVAGIALLGLLWTASRRYWYALIMVASLGLLRGLFNDELLTEFQSVWILVSAGFVVFVLLVVLMTRVLKADHDKRVAAAAYAAAHPAVQSGVVATAPAAFAAPVIATPAIAATEPAPAATRLVPPPVPAFGDVVVASAPAPGAEAETPSEVKAARKAAKKAARETAESAEARVSAEAPGAEASVKD